MPNRSKITCFVLLFAVLICNTARAKGYSIPSFSISQIDSLIQEKTINNNMTKLELLVLYQNAWENKHPDSIIVFKNLAILNAELDQPKDALFFTDKYITNTLDFSVLKNGAYDVINETKEYKELADKYLPKINALTFFYFCVSLIGFFFIVIINFTKSVNKEAKIFIGIFVGAHSLLILEFVLYISNLQYKFPHTYLTTSSLILLFGPTLYFYFKSVIQQYKFKLIDILHFLPTVVVLILLLPIYFSSASEKINMILNDSINYKSLTFVIYMCKILSLLIYIYIISKTYFKFNHGSEKAIKPIEGWMKVVYIMHIAFVIFYILHGVFVYLSLGVFSDFVSYIYVGILTSMVMYISYMAYKQPNIFNGDYDVSLKKIFVDKYKKSGLTESLSNELKENLIHLLVKEEVYKESNINLEILSKKLNTTRHNTSQIINEHFNMNFFELINKFRIKEAIRILESNIHGSLNIIDIAYEVGYNNKVTFNKAFKKETSLTPSEYLNSKINNKHK